MKTTQATTNVTMKAEIIIWSAIGHTPITHRSGSYCDVLLETVREVRNPEDAREIAKELMRSTPGADTAHFNLPEFWNQNTRTGWVKNTDAFIVA
jgi:hypothetical protein